MKKITILCALALALAACDKKGNGDADDAGTKDAGPACETLLADAEGKLKDTSAKLEDKTDEYNGCMTSFPKWQRFEISKSEAPMPCDENIKVDIHKLDSKRNALYLGYRLGKDDRRFSGRLDMAKHPDRRVLLTGDVLMRVDSCSSSKCKMTCANLSTLED